MTKNEIADILVEIGTLLELKGENPFKVRAYQAGARALEAVEAAELTRLVAEEELKTVKGIGDALAQKITELYRTGRLEFYEKLKASMAPGLIELLQIPGLGPKKIKILHDKLGVAGARRFWRKNPGENPRGHQESRGLRPPPSLVGRVGNRRADRARLARPAAGDAGRGRGQFAPRNGNRR
jgi:DNA polymerase/3'-5' exonuclease PolX